jgi:hypothetical protein
MKQQIAVKVIHGKSKRVLFKDTNLMEISDNLKVAEIIPQIKLLVQMSMDVESEKFFCGNDELKLENVVPNTSGNELEIIVK